MKCDLLITADKIRTKPFPYCIMTISIKCPIILELQLFVKEASKMRIQAIVSAIVNSVRRRIRYPEMIIVNILIDVDEVDADLNSKLTKKT